MGEVEVGLLLQGGVVGADNGRDWFDVEEEVFVDAGDLGLTGAHGGFSGRRDRLHTVSLLLTVSLYCCICCS